MRHFQTEENYALKHQWNINMRGVNHPQQINKQLCSSFSLSNAFATIEKSSHLFNIVNVATAFSRLAKILSSTESSKHGGGAMETKKKMNDNNKNSEKKELKVKVLFALLKRCKNVLRANDKKQLEPRHLSTILWSIGKMRMVMVFAIEEDFETFGEELVHVLDAISNVVVEYYEAKRQFNAQEISNLFWASAKVYGDASALKKKKSSSCHHRRVLVVFEGVEDAIVRMQAPLQRMFAASKLNEWTTQGVSNVCWSLAKMLASETEGDGKKRMVWVVDDECDVRKSISDAVEMGCSGPPAKRFNAQEFANVAWAMAKFNEAPNDEDANGGREVLVNKMALELKELLISETVKGRFESRHVANTFLAFAKVNQCAEDPKFWFKLKTLTKSAVLKNMNAHELSMVMVGVSLVNESNGEVGGEDDEEEDKELAYEVCRFFTKTIASYTDDTNNETDDDETGKVGLIANVLWALAKLPQLLGEIAKKQEKVFINEMLRVLEQSNGIANMNGRQASTILWSLAKIGDVVGFEDTGIKSTFEHFSRTHFCDARSSLFFKTKTDARSFSMILWAFSNGVPDVATNERAKDVFESAHKDLRKENFIDEFNARDLANVTEAFAKRLDTPEKVLKTIAKRAAEILDTFNAQELLKFLGALERAGGDVHKYEKLNELLRSKRTVKIPFPALGLVDESAIKLRSATPSNDASKQIGRVDDSCGGFGRQNTGVALWEGSRVLAEWISRLSTVDLHAFCSNDAKWKKLGEDGFFTPHLNARDAFFGKGKVGVELGAGLGLPSIVASKLGANVIATDGTCIFRFFTNSSRLVSYSLCFMFSYIRSG